MKNAKLIWSLAIAIFVLTVALQNTHLAEFKFLIWTKPMSLALLLALTFAVGALSGMVAGLWMVRTRRGRDAEQKGTPG
jgi:uncharacterized integral membrane protein